MQRCALLLTMGDLDDLGFDVQFLLGHSHATSLELRRFIARYNLAMITLENRMLFTFLCLFPSLPYPQP